MNWATAHHCRAVGQWHIPAQIMWPRSCKAIICIFNLGPPEHSLSLVTLLDSRNELSAVSMARSCCWADYSAHHSSLLTCCMSPLNVLAAGSCNQIRLLDSSNMCHRHTLLSLLLCRPSKAAGGRSAAGNQAHEQHGA